MNGKLLATLRKQHKLSQEKFAKAVGVSRSAVAMWETNSNEPDHETLNKIAELFDITTDELLGRENPKEQAKKAGVRIPVYGTVAAGIPLEAVTDIEDWEEIDEVMASKAEYIALRIHGRSMEPRILDGDVVIVQLQDFVEDGDIGIIFVNGDDATCKKIKKTPKGIMLISNNPAYEPMFYSNEEIENLPVRVLGKVVELRGKF